MRALAALFALLAVAQQPQIQNGTVETRKSAGLDRDIAAIAATAAEPTWVGWRETAVDGWGNNCCWYSDDNFASRGCSVEPRVPNTRGFAGMDQPDPRPQFPAPSGPAKLEAGTEVLVMVRLVDRHVERIRTFSDDCPLDAGGRKVYWLDGVPAGDSVKYLASLIQLKEVSGTPTDLRRRINSAAVSAIGMHRDGNIEQLIALAKQNTDATSRSSAFTWLGRSKDPRAVAFIDGILKR
ncbi:MAG: hypothetical protein EPO35_06365 [Acidobacteria bacterium]|nr:MAG: hypothetical protein EPO35_06365 [Acidobacteriota bacterium]